MLLLRNRKEAGQRLAALVMKYRNTQPVLFGIPRGGVIVAAEIAKSLHARLHVLIVRKIGAPGNSEVAIGAVMPAGTTIMDKDAIRRWEISREYIEKAVAEQLIEIKRRQLLYQGAEGTPELAGKTVILVDDGIATGYTVMAAVQGLRIYKPREIIIAAAVAPEDVVKKLQQVADEVICLDIPEPFYAVGQFYEEFNQTTDEEVIDTMREINQLQAH